MDDRPGIKRTAALHVAALTVFALLSGVARADDATVLPKGASRFLLDGQWFFPITERYNHEGNAEDLATDFNTELDSDVFPALQPLDPFVPGGKASIGTSVVSFELGRKELAFQPAYGVTNRFSIGANIPYLWLKNTVTATVDPSTANVGKNPALACGGPICPAGTPGNETITTDDVQNLLGPGLDVGGVLIPGFGFERVETWSGEGFGDIDLGGRYQYLSRETWRLAFTGAVRLPTGAVDDPNNLVDTGFGNGTYALLFRFHQDWINQPDSPNKQIGVLDPGTWVVNTTLRYDWYLPDHEPLRVCGIHTPVCLDQDNVKRDLGDVAEAEISMSVGLVKGLSFSPLYQYGHGFKSHYSGDQGLDYQSLEVETDYNEHIFMASFGYSTLPLFLEKQFPVPLNAAVTYRIRFAGNNNLNKSQYVGLTVAAFF